jgi:CubicO group peptidase (beta-lactamase class C family)
MSPTRRTFLKQIGSSAALLGSGAFSFQHLFADPVAAAIKLPRSTPEAQGISSSAILDFLDGLAQNKAHEIQSVMIARHGQVIAEGWWAPYGPRLIHTLYSLSKSFTSTAIGFAVTEGKLTVNDPVTSFFQDDLPAEISDNLKALRVKHLLTMSVGHEKEHTFEIVKHENWVKEFLTAPIEHAPGSRFVYNSAATYTLSAIVQHLTGQKVIDYLTPRLFKPLGIENVTWETCPRGINTGGWGLSIHTEDIAKMGQLLLQKGLWEGQQIIPAKWVEEATTFKIQQPDPAKPTRPHEENDWLQGYCYQFWRSQHHCFRGDGAFGQFMVVMPEQDAVVAITGESKDLQGELDLIWKHLLPAMKDAPLAEDAPAHARLKQTLASLALHTPEGQASSPTAARIDGKVFQLEKNDLGLESFSFTFPNNGCQIKAHDAKNEHVISSGFNDWHRGATALPGTPPRLINGGMPPAGTLSKVAARAAWKDENTLSLLWRYIETPHHDNITCQFNGDEVTITFVSSIVGNRTTADKRPVLKGKLVA